MDNCHTPYSDKRVIACVAEIKGLYIYRCIKGRQLPRRFRAVGAAKAGSGGNGGKGGFTEDEAGQLKGALLDLSNRIRRAAENIPAPATV